MEMLLPLLPLPSLAAFAILAVAPVDLTARRIGAIAAAAGALTLALLLPPALACADGDCTIGPVTVARTPAVGALGSRLALALDPVALVAASTVALVASLVLVFSTGFMQGETVRNQRRFFALMSLFAAAMLTFVLADDAVLLFLGWEMIGLCSFFLIAFETRKARAVAAGRKAFVMTRIADTMLLTGLVLLFLEADSLRLEDMAATVGDVAEPAERLAGALILAGALGKSAQLPLQTWLPDAMAGPAPVSALLHSATMVAAGVILLARLSPLLEALPIVAWAATVLGLATALLGGLAALAQDDVKRLLAYSTISQIGYMITAVGVGAPEAAMAHFAIHAVFKSLLFLSAGVLTRAAGESRRLADLAGSRRRAPVAYWTFAAGAVSLGGLPFVTAGWFSKERILTALWHAGAGGPLLWAVAIAAAVLTTAYAVRPLVAMSRAAPARAPRGEGPRRPLAIRGPLLLLAAGALTGGFVVEKLVDLTGEHGTGPEPLWHLVAAGVAASLTGLFVGLALMRWRRRVQGLPLVRLLRRGFRFDAAYRAAVVRPFRKVAGAIAEDPVGEALPRAFAATLGSAEAVRGRSGVRTPETGLPARLARDPLDRWVSGGASRGALRVIAATVPDRLDRALETLGRAAAEAADRARGLQTGRARDYALAVAIGLVLLLVLAWRAPWN